MEIDIRYRKGSRTFRDYERMFQDIPVALQADAYAAGGRKFLELVQRIAVATAPSDKRAGKAAFEGLYRTRYKDSFVILGSNRKRGRGRRGGGTYRAAYRVADAFLWNKAPHASLVEFGTEERRTAAGRRTGKMPAFHVMRNATDAVAGQAPGFYAKAIKNSVKRIERQMRTGRITRKTGRALATLDGV